MIVYAQPGFAIDWSWLDELTVWSTGHDRADRLIATHRLDHAPHNERAAATVAARWWRHEGRSSVATAAATAEEKEVVAP